MEQIGNIVKRSQSESLVLRSQDSITTTRRPKGTSQWVQVLVLMGQDKRHDLAPGILDYWASKLCDFHSDEICEALTLWTGEFFPSVDDISKSIERMRERRAEEQAGVDAATLKTEREKIEQFMREHGGKTPAQVFCEENPDLLRHLDMKLNSQPSTIRPRGDVVALAQAKALRTAGRG